MAQKKKAGRAIGKKKNKTATQKKRKSVAPKKRKSKPEKFKISQAAETWPMQRNVLFRPERLPYIRKTIKFDGCVFCRSAQQAEALETLCVYKSEHSQVVLNKFPYNTGHVLVLPLRHTGDMLKLSDAEYIDLQLTLKKAVQAIKEVYDPNAFNIGLNHGIGGGAGIPDHLHYHIVPRWHGDLNFFPLIAETKVVVETLAESYSKLSEYFAKNKGGL